MGVGVGGGCECECRVCVHGEWVRDDMIVVNKRTTRALASYKMLFQFLAPGPLIQFSLELIIP